MPWPGVGAFHGGDLDASLMRRRCDSQAWPPILGARNDDDDSYALRRLTMAIGFENEG